MLHAWHGVTRDGKLILKPGLSMLVTTHVCVRCEAFRRFSGCCKRTIRRAPPPAPVGVEFSTDGGSSWGAAKPPCLPAMVWRGGNPTIRLDADPLRLSQVDQGQRLAAPSTKTHRWNVIENGLPVMHLMADWGAGKLNRCSRCGAIGKKYNGQILVSENDGVKWGTLRECKGP